MTTLVTADPAPIPTTSTAEVPRRGGPRPRYQARRRSWWQRIPFAVKAVVPALLLVTAHWTWSQWQRQRVVVEFRGIDGQPAPALRIVLFPDQLAFTAPSPPPPLAELELAAGDALVLDRHLGRDSALLRYEGEGIGTGFTFVHLGRKAGVVQLRSPAAIAGRVVETSDVKSLALGAAATGFEPIEGAVVIAMGGGEHGVPLATTRTDAQGRFVLAGFAADQPSIGLRVRKPGFAQLAVEQRLDADEPPPQLVLTPTEPIRGRVVAPEGVDVASLRVLAKGLPGVEAAIGADGAFALDHVPKDLTPRLLLYGLSERFTHREVRGTPGSACTIAIEPAGEVRGFVLDAITRAPVGDALVWHGHGPTGMTAVRSDENGAFVLGALPPGDVEIAAQVELRFPGKKPRTKAGSRQLRIDAGERRERIAILVE